jgi:hypothetical protein
VVLPVRAGETPLPPRGSAGIPGRAGIRCLEGNIGGHLWHGCCFEIRRVVSRGSNAIERGVQMSLEPAEGVTAILEPSFPPETRCFNCGGFQFFLAREVAEANRYGYFTAYALFRLVPSDGGEHLKKLVETLSRSIRATDYIGVLDQSTVGVIFQHATVQNAKLVLERLRGELKWALIKGNGVSLRDACGVFPTEANTLEALRLSVEARLGV